MVYLSEQMFSVVWYEETIPRQWRVGLIVYRFKKGNREDRITLLSVVSNVFLDW